MAEPRAVSALRLGKVHPSARCLATPALNSESDDFAAPPPTADVRCGGGVSHLLDARAAICPSVLLKLLSYRSCHENPPETHCLFSQLSVAIDCSPNACSAMIFANLSHVDGGC